MNIVYNIGVNAYFLSIRLAAALGHRKALLMQQGRHDWAPRLSQQVEALRQRLGREPRFVWFHAASLGEFEQGRPLIEALRQQYPDYQVLQTFFSPSGYEVRKGYRGADIVCYLPYDRPSECRRFLDIVRPEQAIFVKYEFWGNILEELHRRQVPTWLVSGIFRQRQVFFHWYGGMMRPVLRLFRHLFVQDDESARLLGTLGLADRTTICGDTRFDRVLDICRQSKTLPWAEQFVAADEAATDGAAPFVLVAGSSWPKDEDIILDHFNSHPEMRLIIAPHEIHEEHIQGIIAKLRRPYVRYSQLRQQWERGEVPADTLPVGAPRPEAIIVDAIGFLSSIYRYGHAAYIGGGFGVGIHNTLEAAVYGIPVVFGPNHQAFREALGLIDARGGFAITTADDYHRVITRLMTDADALAQAGHAAGRYVQEGSGATAVIFQALFGHEA